MSFNIWHTFASSSGRQINDSNIFYRQGGSKHIFILSININSTLHRYLAYAQGLPLVLCLLTYIVDEHGGGHKDFLPNMAKYSCFLGQEYGKFQEYGYFKHPIFIYFQSVLMTIQIANMIFLCLTLKYL